MHEIQPIQFKHKTKFYLNTHDLRSTVKFMGKSGSKFLEDDVPDLTGKIVVVTGANGGIIVLFLFACIHAFIGVIGIGLAVSKILALKGANLILAARNEAKLILVADQIRQYVTQKDQPPPNIDIAVVDLASMSSIAAFADTLKS